MRDIGRIDATDYLQILGHKPRRGLIATLAMCAVFIGGGFGGGYWNGKNSRDLTLDQALAVLTDAPKESWRRLSALGATHRGITKGLSEMCFWADDPTTMGNDASEYLGNLARFCIGEINRRARDDQSPYQGIHIKSIDSVREMLR